MGGSVLRFDRYNPSRDPVPVGKVVRDEPPSGPTALSAARAWTGIASRRAEQRHVLGRTTGAVTHLQHGGARAPFRP
jgi:hypothetical protein